MDFIAKTVAEHLRGWGMRTLVAVILRIMRVFFCVCNATGCSARQHTLYILAPELILFTNLVSFHVHLLSGPMTAWNKTEYSNALVVS